MESVPSGGSGKGSDCVGSKLEDQVVGAECCQLKSASILANANRVNKRHEWVAERDADCWCSKCEHAPQQRPSLAPLTDALICDILHLQGRSLCLLILLACCHRNLVTRSAGCQEEITSGAPSSLNTAAGTMLLPPCGDLHSATTERHSDMSHVEMR